jgi:alpha-acetolactate decarboxylase
MQNGTSVGPYGIVIIIVKNVYKSKRSQEILMLKKLDTNKNSLLFFVKFGINDTFYKNKKSRKRDANKNLQHLNQGC